MRRSVVRRVRRYQVVLGAFTGLLLALALFTQAGAQDQGSCFGQPATITGTDQAETITGTEGPDVIDGRGGVDTIDGLGGNDLICAGVPPEGGQEEELTGGLGSDRLRGGPDADDLFLRDGVRDREADCGDGGDDVDLDLADNGQQTRGTPPPRFPPGPIPVTGCEGVTIGAVNEGPNARVSRRAVRLTRRGVAGVRLACPQALPAACAGRLSLSTVRKRRRTLALASSRYRIAPGTSRVVRVRLSRARRTLVRNVRSVRVRGTAVEQGEFGAKTTIATFLLRRAR